MEAWLVAMIVGGIGGGIAAARKVSGLNAQVRANPCPRCGDPLTGKRPGRRTWTQVLWGGWTCPDCGCDVDRFGEERSAAGR